MILEAEKYGKVTEIWIGTSYLLPALVHLRPNSRITKVDHGLSDFVTNGQLKSTSALQRIKRVSRKILELSLFPFANLVPTSTERYTLNEVVKFHRSTYHELWSELGDKTSVKNFTTSTNSFNNTLILTPPLYSEVASDLMESFAEWICQISGVCEPGSSILLKAHPTDKLRGASEYVEDLQRFLAAKLSNCDVSVLQVPSEIPAELIVSKGVHRVAGVISTTLILAKVYDPTIKCAQISWTQQLEVMRDRFNDLVPIPGEKVRWIERSLSEYEKAEEKMESMQKLFPDLFWLPTN